MKLYKSFLAATAMSTLLLGSCADDFAEMNQDKAAVTTPNASYLFAQTVNVFEACGYTYWFYNAPMMYSWNQMGVPTGGMTNAITATTATGDQGSQYINTLRYVREIENTLSNLPEEEAASMTSYQAAAEVLTIYLAIFDSDNQKTCI